MKKHSKKILLACLTLVYLATAAIGMVRPAPAYAAPVIDIHNLDPQQQMATFMLAATLMQCAAAHGLAASANGNDIVVPDGNADSGAWFDSGGVDVGLAKIGLPESDYVQGDPRYYQQLACENSDWVNKAVAALGYKAQGNIPADRVALCDLAKGNGTSFFARSGGGDCLNGSGDYGYNPGSGDKTFAGVDGVKGDVAQAFENVLEARLGLAKGALQSGGDMPSGPAMYLYWYAYFTTLGAAYSCEAAVTPGATGDQAYPGIHYIDQNGVFQKKGATFKSTDGKNQDSDVKYAGGLGGEHTKKCGSKDTQYSVAWYVDQNAPLMSRYMSRHPEYKINLTTRDPSNSAGNQSCGQTGDGVNESCDDPTLDCGAGGWNWAICPFIQIALKAGQAMDNLIMSNLNTDAKPIFDDPSNGFYKAWNSFRMISTALIVIAGLIMVISQALGFELLDAYTIRKTLPRLFIAIVGISLSWPLMHFVVVLFDTIGFDIRSLIYSPFSSITHEIGAGTGIFLQIAAPLVALFVMGPMVLTFLVTAALAIFVGLMVLIVRQIAIIMLVIVAPIAIACYVLPNTQKVWKLWSQNFLGLMLAFPIISALIAAGHVFALVSTGPTSSVFSQIIGFIAYFLPYFLIPVALRMATGVIGTIAGFVNDRNRGVFDKLKKSRGEATAKRMGYYKQHYGDRAMQARAEGVRRLNARASSSGRFKGGLMRFAGRQIAPLGGIEPVMSAINARTSKEVNDQIQTGADPNIRGLTVNKKAIDRMGWDAALAASNAAAARGDTDGQLVREERQKDGTKKRQYKSMGGAWIDEADVIDGHNKWGHDVAAQQAALSYEMRKAMEEGESEGLRDRYVATARDQWGMTETQARGAWIGASFEQQNKNLGYKATDIDYNAVTTADGRGGAAVDGSKLLKEAYYKKGAYSLSQMDSETIRRMDDAHKDAVVRRDNARVEFSRATNDEDRRKWSGVEKDAQLDIDRAKGIAETFMHEFGGPAGRSDGEEPIIDATTGAPLGGRQVGGSGAAAVNEAARQFAMNTGVLRAAPNNPPVPGATSTKSDPTGNSIDRSQPGGPQKR